MKEMDNAPTYIHLLMIVKCNHGSFKTPDSCNFSFINSFTLSHGGRMKLMLRQFPPIAV